MIAIALIENEFLLKKGLLGVLSQSVKVGKCLKQS